MTRDYAPQSKRSMYQGYHHSMSTNPVAPRGSRHPYYSYGGYHPPHSHSGHPPPHCSLIPSPGVSSHDNMINRQQHHVAAPQGQPSPYSVTVGSHGTPPASYPHIKAKQKAKNCSSKSKASTPSRKHSNENQTTTENSSCDNTNHARDGSLPPPVEWHHVHSPYHPHPPFGLVPESQWGPPFHTHHWGPHHPPPIARYPVHPPPPAILSRDGNPYWTAGRSAPASEPSSAGGTPNRADIIMPPTAPASNVCSDVFNNDVDGREGATSPSQIEINHRDEVEHMGCTCKKTKCLKLYCQCFGIKIYCGSNCRCKECFNNQDNEKERKEAMRSIISRNPSAFETKFKKTGQSAPIITVTSIAPPLENGRVLAHKLGCKCRKSNCMKKYCECYAASVKCNSTCRCMGCKNMGSSTVDYRENAPSHDGHSIPYNVLPCNIYPPAQVQVTAAPSSQMHNSGEPWVAAQNLTFLKRSSPASEQKRLPSGNLESSSGEMTSMPSLASSSGGTSPDDAVLSKKPRLAEEDDNGANALLMAAVAMTEFGQSPPPSQKYLDMKKSLTTPDATMASTGQQNAEVTSTPFSPVNSKFHPDSATFIHHRNGETIKDQLASSPPLIKRSLDFEDALPMHSRKKQTIQGRI